MAPERFSNGTADARADVYSLACVLHECLTGVQPYPGDSAEQQIAGHLTLDPPKPSKLNPTIPATFDEVIAKGMAKQPSSRFSSAGELARAASAAVAFFQSPTALSPSTSQPVGTRQFPAQWPNPAGTGYTPYSEHVRVSEPAPHRGLGRAQLALAALAVAMFGVAAMIAMLLIFRGNAGSPQGSRAPVPPSQSITETTTEPPTTTALRPTTSPGRVDLPDADAQGFLNYPGARCNYTNPAVAIGLTPDSAVVICQTGVGRFYYRGFGLSNRQSVEIDDPTPSGTTFTATNNGVQYLLSPDALTITQGSVVLSREPMKEYWPNWRLPEIRRNVAASRYRRGSRNSVSE